MAQAHHRVWFERLNVRFIWRHFAKTIKRDERGFYYSNTRLASRIRKEPPCRDLYLMREPR
jgi:hypothetical protein